MGVVLISGGDGSGSGDGNLVITGNGCNCDCNCGGGSGGGSGGSGTGGGGSGSGTGGGTGTGGGSGTGTGDGGGTGSGGSGSGSGTGGGGSGGGSGSGTGGGSGDSGGGSGSGGSGSGGSGSGGSGSGSGGSGTGTGGNSGSCTCNTGTGGPSVIYVMPPPPPSPPPYGGTSAHDNVVEINCNITLTATDIANKYIELPDDCAVTRAITLTLANMPQLRNEDWAVVGNMAPTKDRIMWGGMGMERYAEAGDIVSLTYYKYLTPPPPPSASDNVVEVNHLTRLTQQNITNKYLELPEDCEVNRAITVTLENLPQIRNEDWVVIENVNPEKDRISWAGFDMERYVEVGDLVGITYYKKA